MRKITLSELKTYLQERSKTELINEIADLFDKFSVVQNYYQAQIYPVDEEELLHKYKTIIKEEFFSDRGFGKARRSVAKQAVSEYKKVSGNPSGIADLMLYYIEMGVEFTNRYGDMHESFYNSLASMYYKTLQFLFKQGLQDTFQPRCQELLESTRHVGWGFYDMLREIYYEYYGIEND